MSEEVKLRKKPVKVSMLQPICRECKIGELKATGQVNKHKKGVQYIHICDKCGAFEAIPDRVFPIPFYQAPLDYRLYRWFADRLCVIGRLFIAKL